MKNPPKRNNCTAVLPPIKRDPDEYNPVGKKYVCVVCKTSFWAEKKRSVCTNSCRRLM